MEKIRGKKKNGRPLKKELKKTKYKKFRVTDDENEYINQFLRDSKLGVRDIFMIGLEKQKSRRPFSDQLLIAQIRKIGHNLNQVAKALHMEVPPSYRRKSDISSKMINFAHFQITFTNQI